MSNTKQRILQTAAELFASKGFDNLTMRDIAGACDIKAPSLYNHFKDKQELYYATLQYVFSEQGAALVACLQTEQTAQVKLNDFIVLACRQMASDSIFRQLFIRELLVQDEASAQFLVKVVIADTCNALHDIFVEINPDCDPHFLTTSLLALLLFHFQVNPIRPLLPGASSEAQSTDYLISNIQSIIQHHLSI